MVVRCSPCCLGWEDIQSIFNLSKNTEVAVCPGDNWSSLCGGLATIMEIKMIFELKERSSALI